MSFAATTGSAHVWADSLHAGASAGSVSPAESHTPPACGAGSSAGTITEGSKGSDNTSTASVSFYTSVDAASRSVIAGTSVGRAVSCALAELGEDMPDMCARDAHV